MDTVYENAKSAVEHGEDAVLCRIIRADGSSPRKKGACMLVYGNGKSVGSVGGGALEKYCIQKASVVLDTRAGFTLDFDLAGKVGEVSMICGGKVSVEFVLIDGKNMTPEDVDGLFAQQAAPVRVVVFGGGHVGRELVPVLEHLGFSVTVFDNRPEFASEEMHPMAARCICGDYTDISKSVSIKPADYVAIMTHGHLGDMDVLLQVMRTGAAYVGLIGSRRKVAATFEFLREHGIPEEEISRIHAPIGIELYGDTPQEIAISIAAEMIRHRAVSAGLDRHH